jgi:phospholipid transport system substrate-binding protein
MTRVKQLFIGFLCLFMLTAAFASQASAATTPDPMTMLKKTTDTLLSTLKDNRAKLKSNPKYIYKIVDKVLLPHVNVRVMAMSVLGRNAWFKATESQKEAFTKEFTTTVIKTYASALNAFTDESIKFSPIRGGYSGRKILQVNSKVVRPDGPPVPVSYSMILQNNVWKVYDLNVEGISLLQSFRSQFASQLAQGDSIATIISNLKKHNAKMK